MDNYNYPKRLKAIWKAAVAKYEAGQRDPADFFCKETLAELASFGLNVMDVFDYAEDYVNGGDPDFENFLLICEARRDYFYTVQKGVPSTNVLDSETLPAKTEALDGIRWLPRIIPKAIAKLKGELPPETMYCCGGDRNFFKTNNIHPAEFLRAAWAYEEDIDKLVEWVKSRKDS